MNLTTDDLINLHINVKEQVVSKFIVIHILKSIQRLIESNKLIIKKEIDISC